MISSPLAFFTTILCGILFALSQPFVSPIGPSNIVNMPYQGLLGLIAFVPFLLVLDQLKFRARIFYSYLLFFIANILIQFWIFVALYDFGDIPFRWSFLFWLLSVLFIITSCGMTFPLTSWLEEKADFPRWLAFPIALCATEWVRGHFPVGGFSMGNIGHSLVTVPVIAQAASVVGMYGLIFFGAFVNASIADIIRLRKTRAMWPAIMALTVMTFSVAIYGIHELNTTSPYSDKSISVAILQGNIPVKIKKNQLAQNEFVMDTYTKLHDEAVKQDVDLIIWPETSFPRLLPRDAKQVPDFGAFRKTTILGVVSQSVVPDILNGGFYVTAFVVQSNAKITDAYDKIHLIPLAEYLPAIAKLLLRMPLNSKSDFQAGQEIRPLHVEIEGKTTPYKIGTLICYDGIYTDVTRQLTLKGAELLIQLSNDDWYIASAAPYQFLNMYRLRAIETGRTLIRAANSGMSGWIDPHGVVHDASKVSEKKLIVAKVPIATRMTPYVLWGDVVPWACCVVVVSLLVLELLRFLRGFFAKPIVAQLSKDYRSS